MNRQPIQRGLALLLSLILLCFALPTAGLADGETPIDDIENIVSDAIEQEIPEEEEFSLAPEFELEPVQPDDPQPAPIEEAAPAEDAALAKEPALIEDAEPAAVMAPAAETVLPEVPGWTNRAFAQTQAIDSATWDTLNLVRAGGFTGKLATVSGTLTLKNVLIEGEAANAAALTDSFELGPYGSIALDDGAKLRLSLNALSFNKGDKKTLKLKWKGKSLAGSKAKWKSSNKKVVKVNKNGKLTAKGPGTATITVTYKKNKVVCQVVVTNIIYVKKVKLSKSKLTLAMNSTLQLKATATPTNAVDTSITWSSSNSNIVSVDQNGRISGLAGGKATITAKSANGKTAKCKVTVKEIKPKSVSFSSSFITLNPGSSAPTAVGMSPANVSNPRVLYSSSNSGVARVDENGVITAVSTGRAIITVKAAAKTSVSSSCTVFVVAPNSGRLAGLVIGINPGHQTKTIKKKYPLAPGSKKTAYGCKVGAQGRWTRVPEYEVVLQIGLKLSKMLTEAGATVVMTRTRNDVSLTNIDRAKILNKAGVDVALQLHCNSSTKKSHNGVSGFVRSTGSWYKQSKALSKAVVSGISATTGMVNKGTKVNNNYMSLNWTTTPSVLLEMGYLSNKNEDRLLATDEFRQKIAQGIFNGLCAYYGR